MALRELFGKSKRSAYDKLMAVTKGEDRTLVRRDIESTGLSFINGRDLLGYDSSPEAVGKAILHRGGKEYYIGACCSLFEPMARPFSFDSLDWIPELRMSSRSKLLASARNEARSRVVQDIEDEANYDRVSTGFLILVALFAIVGLLFLLQSGIIQDIIG
jgi:hypothetical protein